MSIFEKWPPRFEKTLHRSLLGGLGVNFLEPFFSLLLLPLYRPLRWGGLRLIKANVYSLSFLQACANTTPPNFKQIVGKNGY
jgi:hypothetical protein